MEASLLKDHPIPVVVSSSIAQEAACLRPLTKVIVGKSGALFKGKIGVVVVFVCENESFCARKRQKRYKIIPFSNN